MMREYAAFSQTKAESRWNCVNCVDTITEVLVLFWRKLFMALRIMLPSKARVGDTIHFSFPNGRLPGTTISSFQVAINGKQIDKPEILTTRATGGGSSSFVFKVNEPGTYQFEIIPIRGEEKGERRLNTLEVEN
jgi:hypothetical protein